MGVSSWAYLGFTALLFLTFVGLILYYFAPKRKSRIEKPKYTILDDDEPQKEEVSDAGKRRHTGKSS